MRFAKLTTLIAIAALLMISTPMFADSFTVISQPNAFYTGNTINYGGGDGSGLLINSLGPFSFSNLQSEHYVPGTWGTWGCPPATESCTPNVLWNAGFSTLTITTSDRENTIGFELEPDQFVQESVTATFYASDGMFYSLTLNPNGSNGALLFAVQDDTPGSYITHVDIVDNAGDDFAIAQLRTGNSGTTPEPGTMILLGTGLLGALGVMRRKMNL